MLGSEQIDFQSRTGVVEVRRMRWAGFVLTLVMGLLLAGCGQASVVRVIQRLQNVQNSLTSYKSSAVMTVRLQDAVQKYYVETWYQAPNQYRIALGHDAKDISQIILHNSQGIYIISPSTKKVIRFQGDWAERQGHLYLYHSLIGRIVSSANPDMSSRDKVLTFTVPADPVNPIVTTQQIVLDEASYAPKQVVLLNKDKQPVITMDYTSFQSGVTFAANAFTPDQATSLQAVEMPVSAVEQGFGIVEPTWVPGNDEMASESETNGVVFVRYGGKQPFTLAEQRPGTENLSLGAGSLLTLYGIPAVLTGNSARNLHQLYWLDNGVEFQLTSRMSVPDLIKVAASTVQTMGK